MNTSFQVIFIQAYNLPVYSAIILVNKMFVKSFIAQINIFFKSPFGAAFLFVNRFYKPKKILCYNKDTKKQKGNNKNEKINRELVKKSNEIAAQAIALKREADSYFETDIKKYLEYSEKSLALMEQSNALLNQWLEEAESVFTN